MGSRRLTVRSQQASIIPVGVAILRPAASPFAKRLRGTLSGGRPHLCGKMWLSAVCNEYNHEDPLFPLPIPRCRAARGWRGGFWCSSSPSSCIMIMRSMRSIKRACLIRTAGYSPTWCGTGAGVSCRRSRSLPTLFSPRILRLFFYCSASFPISCRCTGWNITPPSWRLFMPRSAWPCFMPSIAP